MYPSRGARAHEADQYERENEERMGQLHNRITNLKNVRQPSARAAAASSPAGAAASAPALCPTGAPAPPNAFETRERHRLMRALRRSQ
jgi:hypothetical protein